MSENDPVDRIIRYENELRKLLRGWALAVPEEYRVEASIALNNLTLTFREQDEYPWNLRGYTFETWWLEGGKDSD